MNFMSPKLRIVVFIAFAILSTTIIFLACSKEDEKKEEAAKPEIVGCDEVKYKGVTYPILGCSNSGVAAFGVTITPPNGRTVSFSVTCSRGCISSVTVTGEGKSNAITAP